MASSQDLQVVLHAGTYKTATSTIQTLMFRNRDSIARRYGLLYPKTGTRRNTGSANSHSVAHHLFYHAVRDDKTRTSKQQVGILRDRLAEEIAAQDAKRIVLCSELFASSSRAAKKAFLEMLGGAKLSVVYSVRRPDDYVESMANQAYKNFRTPKIDVDGSFGMLRNVAEWDELLGHRSVQVLTFSKSDYPGYLRRVFEVLGVDPEDPLIDHDLHDNPAMTLTGFLMRRTLLRRLGALGVEVDRSLRHRLNVELDKLETTLPKSPKALFLSPVDRENVMAANREQMETLTDWMTAEEAALLLNDLALPVSKTPRNTDVDPTMNAETLAGICEGFTSEFFRKTLSW
ncbi:hypothetical protein ACFSDD_23630 [Salipiger marinus]|uniref:Sulfotransferase family protein n=1 Tax=Salipiger marinus TaxID=555512 RepID=A0A1G8QIB3_9RHOB|nr:MULTISPECIES: hypothetical protein [Salipiger]MEB3421090.1 hypothetical protein [Salipiger manganoxidans]SDJ04529.1 hypothetical protein SAMN04487993_10165 [Salipiger marinus]